MILKRERCIAISVLKTRAAERGTCHRTTGGEAIPAHHDSARRLWLSVAVALHVEEMPASRAFPWRHTSNGLATA